MIQMIVRGVIILQEKLKDLYVDDGRISLPLMATTIVVALVASWIICWWWLIRKQLTLLRASTFFHARTNNNNDKRGIIPQDPFRMIRLIPVDATVGEMNSTNDNRAKSSLQHSTMPKTVQMLELNPDFARQYSNTQWKMMSLGDYLSSLRPYLSESQKHVGAKLPDWLETELQAALAAALLKGFGPQLGTIVLPTLGLNIIQGTIRKIVGYISSHLPGTINNLLDQNDADDVGNNVTGSRSKNVRKQQPTFLETILNDDDDDRAGLPVSISAMSSMAELNYQRHKSKSSNSNVVSSLDLLRTGEVGYKHSFGDGYSVKMSSSSRSSSSNNSNDDAVSTSVANVPNPFIMSDHWMEAIELMEQRIIQQEQCDTTATATGTKYDPHSYSGCIPLPRPIDERWFPDLYFGWGDALCTHTHREILQNRLMATLLNRLASNYLVRNVSKEEEDGVDDYRTQLFRIQMSRTSASLIQPCEFIEALIDAGYTVETSIQTQTTTFGVALCVKEPDHSWTNIPLAYFLQNGFSDIYGNESYLCLPHSGLNLEVKGGKDCLINKVSIQHYMAIEGLCGWHSNHCVDVPWINIIVCKNSIRINRDSLDSIRMAGLQAVLMNLVGTNYDLPYGGYGLTGVCNDSAAQLEWAMSSDGLIHIYPITFVGKFAMQTLRVAYELRNTLLQTNLGNQSSNTIQLDIESLDRLIQSIMALPSDTNTAPSNAIDQCRRQLYCQSENPPFTILKQSRAIVESIQNDLQRIQSYFLKNSNSA